MKSREKVVFWFMRNEVWDVAGQCKAGRKQILWLMQSREEAVFWWMEN